MKWERKYSPTIGWYYDWGNSEFRLIVFEEPDEQIGHYQFCMLDPGKHSLRCLEDCLEHWPREASDRTRALLDKLEAELNEEERDNGHEQELVYGPSTDVGAGD